jgi:hypothetical protein
MLLLMMTFLFSAKAEEEHKNIYVAAPTIHDENLEGFQPYINSLLVSSANVNKHWVRRTHKTQSVFIYDRNTIGYALDTVCNYNRPLHCASENYHWVLITDIFTTENFATIVTKLYDEDIQLIASSSKSSYSIENCKPQVKEITIDKSTPQAQSETNIVEKLPDKCVTLKPSILDKDINQAITILFASIHPIE